MEAGLSESWTRTVGYARAMSIIEDWVLDNKVEAWEVHLNKPKETSK